MVVLRSISGSNTPPSVSMPRVSGVTSSSSTSLTSPCSTPAWTAAPSATTSSGFTPLCGSRPKKPFTTSWTLGMRVMPPTRITSSMSEAFRPASLSACSQGPTVRWIRSSTRLSSVQRARGVHRDEGQVHVVLGDGAELLLGLFGLFLQTLQGQLVLAQVDALLLLELVGQVVDQAQVEVLAAQEGVAVGGLHLEHAVADLQDRDVEGAAAEVIDGDLAAFVLFQAVGQGGRGRLVDDAQHFQAGDLAGVLGGLALGVVEVGRDGNDRLLDLLAEEGFGVVLDLAEDEGGYLLGRIVLAESAHPGVAVRTLDDLVGHHALVLGHHRVIEIAADQALDGEEGVGGVSHRLALGGLAAEAFPVFLAGHDRRRGARALRVLDHLGLLAVHDGDARVGGAEVDADDLAHGSCRNSVGGRIRRPRALSAARYRPQISTFSIRSFALADRSASRLVRYVKPVGRRKRNSPTACRVVAAWAGTARPDSMPRFRLRWKPAGKDAAGPKS